MSDEREIGISLDFEKFKQVLIKARINEKMDKRFEGTLKEQADLL